MKCPMEKITTEPITPDPLYATKTQRKILQLAAWIQEHAIPNVPAWYTA